MGADTFSQRFLLPPSFPLKPHYLVFQLFELARTIPGGTSLFISHLRMACSFFTTGSNLVHHSGPTSHNSIFQKEFRYVFLGLYLECFAPKP